ncbi:MAG: hypothetical protein ABI037_04345 [Gemmatimonadales bacterium]
MTALLTSHLSLLTSCDPTLPPLRGQMEIGRDPYAVFVGGQGPNSDLYAVRPDGGPPVRITFTNVAELAPALSPDGGGLAFLRGTSLTDSTPASVWVMNLLSGGERELVLPKGAGAPGDIGWGPRGKSLIVSASKGLYRFNAPPAAPDPHPIPAAERVRAESSFAVLLGDPVFTRVVPCKARRDLCVVGATGKPRLLAQAVEDPVRWGGDSVAFFVGARLQIRPLGPGRPRILMMTSAPERPRGMTFFPGTRER